MKCRTAANDHTALNHTPQETAERPAVPQALLDHIMAHYQKPADLIGENGMLKQLTKAVFEAALNAEMNPHLGHTRHGSVGNSTGNVRNGHSAKTISGDFGEVDIAIPRDRDASFTPQLLPKHQRRVPGFNERILSLYARGLSTREIAAHLREMLGVEVSPTLISTITDTVADEVRWAMAKAALLADVLPRVLSFTGANRLLSAFADQLRRTSGDEIRTLVATVTACIATRRLTHRPDRIEPRAKKRRPKNLPLLTVPRQVARDLILAQRNLNRVP